ncbi:processed acidic surface protein [Pradoshia sp. D12]|uniref:processed acidic surface protein n=1 Tax=Bacillaceae TaxID=186817 RepID=UPI00112C4F34|nr:MULTISPECIES: processed acidic surface protein [Bacillaceae]QFK72903.1 processed acidic surface protein [Pradoshia sp. D12]TPF71895.1 processed acidic surface protein [Bacillus sp. D12]
MKRIVMSLVAFMLLFTVIKPVVGLAEINEGDFGDFAEAEGISPDTLEELILTYLGKEYTEYNSIDDLKEELGEKITEENLNELMETYGFSSRDELMVELEYQDGYDKSNSIEDTYIFINILKHALSWEEFEGTEITDESLKQWLGDYEMTLEELNELLTSHSDSLSNYQYLEDLEEAILGYMFMDAILEGLAEFGIDRQELDNLAKHISSLDFEDPALEEKLLELEKRADNLPEFESSTELTEAQIQEIVDLFNEVLDIYQMEAKFYLTKDGSKKAISIDELMILESTDGADLLIELYNKQGELLADMIITADMFGSDLIDKVTEPVKTVPKPQVENKAGKIINKTINGGKLPNTAGNYAEGVWIGIGILAAGAGLLFFRRKNKEAA